MEAFFEEGSAPRYWEAAPAAIQHVLCSQLWPPVIAATGYAPCIRAWEPVKKGKRVQPGGDPNQLSGIELAPVRQLQELDGSCFTACAMHGQVLAAVTSGRSNPNGNTSKVVLWETIEWQRLAVLELPSNCHAASLALSDQHLAVGTGTGAVYVWQHLSQDSWQPLFEAPLQLDSFPLHSVCLTHAPDKTPLLVVHASGKNALGVWRLSDGRLVHKCEMLTTGEEPRLVTAANMQHMMCAGHVMAGVSHLQGEEGLVVQLMDVLSREGDMLDAPERLAGRGKPLCADFDGALLVVGCQDGALLAAGYRGWLRWHKGAVGAVRVLPHRMQVLSGCAAGEVCLWDVEGQLLSRLDTGFQVTSLACGDVFAVVGGAQGQMQLLILPPAPASNTQPTAERDANTVMQDQLQGTKTAAQGTHTKSQHDVETHGQLQGNKTGVQDSKSQTQNVTQMTQTRAVRPEGHITQYELWYDLRPASQAMPAAARPEVLVGSVMSLDLQQQGLVQACFGVPRVVVDADHFKALHAQRKQLGNTPAGSTETVTGPSGNAPAGKSQAPQGAAASGFDMHAALKGAQRTAKDDAAAAQAAEAAKRQQLQQMGESASVARSSRQVVLAGSLESLGRKCDNPSCLVRQGAVTAAGKCFSRCGGCRRVSYCSQHCQRTHWRDGHNKQCKQWQQQQQQQQQQPQQQQQEVSTLSSTAKPLQGAQASEGAVPCAQVAAVPGHADRGAGVTLQVSQAGLLQEQGPNTTQQPYVPVAQQAGPAGNALARVLDAPGEAALEPKTLVSSQVCSGTLPGKQQPKEQQQQQQELIAAVRVDMDSLLEGLD